jgi:hypothetical protein
MDSNRKARDGTTRLELSDVIAATHCCSHFFAQESYQFVVLYLLAHVYYSCLDWCIIGAG